MAERKQSVTSDEILERERSNKLPAAGAPKISNFRYRDTPLVEVPEDVDDPINPITTLNAPREVTVKSQTISFAPDGTQSVTIVIEFEEVQGADGYEYRISKA